MLVLSADIIENSLTPIEIIEATKVGLINCETGVYQVPTRMHLKGDGIMNLVMPATGRRYFCTKLVSVVPTNKQRNLPIISGSVVLSKMETGESIALLDAPMITALRTAAVGAIGLEIITSKSVEKLGVIGLGVQGVWQTIFACSVRSIKQVYCFSRTKAIFDIYKKKVLEKCPDLELIWCEDGNEVVQKAEAIYACTTSSEPIFTLDEDAIKDKRFISVGSYLKDMQELPNSVYKNADILLMDTEAARHEVGDVINAVTNGFFDDNQVFPIGKILTKERSMEANQNVVFKSVGMAAFDLALASAVYEKIILAQDE